MASTPPRTHTLFETPSGLRIWAFEPPPAGFDPLRATEDELFVHGYPPRPSHGLHRQLWEAAFRQDWTYVTPTFEIKETSRAYRQRFEGPQAGPGGSTLSPNWSGGVVSAPTNTSIFCVTGQWNVPVVEPVSFDGSINSVYAWIGIDGIFGTNDVVQAGIACDIRYVSPDGIAPKVVLKNYYPWFEWFNGNDPNRADPANVAVSISNLPISPGDQVAGIITIHSPTLAFVYLANGTTRKLTSFSFPPQINNPPDPAKGNTAEWIVERPGDGVGGLRTLPVYEPVVFNNALATSRPIIVLPPNRRGNTVLDAGAGTSINMIKMIGSAASVVIAAGTLTGTYQVTCTRVT
ncbi:G1 family glutamic endopeptidase [Nocardia tengchongensis]|uniref:G1 family glutamic endopeptidase n=1 Tax=Nocardia tengchongensis TaxID=2055889 RepID=UPI00367A006A